ncbi:uncharacterized protein N7487_008417 [Penicillium crustosum]|uniref:uncharacterized protein n=1 Tax=Penicillium crustosum TaxID=36656 RepID=UPI002394F55C|nr:uncharacterized protein N7487_008417 [Penicillium crustosum]KAJ5402521.1 hypothetical protein N7487_008417 [Penicillium crustosum]
MLHGAVLARLKASVYCREFVFILTAHTCRINVFCGYVVLEPVEHFTCWCGRRNPARLADDDSTRGIPASFTKIHWN